MKKGKTPSLLAVSTLLLLATACSGQKAAPLTGESTPNKNAAPVTLIFFTAQNSVYAKEEGFEKEIGQYIKAKFPHITIEHIHAGKDQGYAELIAAGKIPDIILESPNNLNGRIIENNLNYDLSDMIKKYNFDLSRINPAVIAGIKNASPDGKLYGLPFTLSNFIMFYNKGLFDKFGVPYPKDGMTYDEVYELAKRVSRTENGVTYKGFMAHSGLMLSWNQLSLSPLSLKEDKADINNDQWKKLVENFLRFYQIPTNPYTNIDEFPKGEMAIGVHVSEKIVSWYDQNKDLDFDLASVPSFPEAPKTAHQPNTYALFVTQPSKHKEEAYQVVAHLLSNEVQTELSKNGVVTPLENKAVHQVFGQNLPQLKGKNTQAVFYSKNALPPAPRAANLISYGVNMGRIFDLILKENKDVVTALRTVEEESNQKITELKAAQGKK